MRTFFLSITAICSAALFEHSALGQLGNDNPTGTSGQYNGNVTTGCSYDPYTSNATRSVTDLTVAGGVGTYPLAFTRTMNTRYTAGVPSEFGKAGNWAHSFNWNIDAVTVTKTGSAGRPASYSVNYPDGRRVIFSDRGTGDTKFRGPPGVRDRFDKLTNTTPNDCYLILPDGGKIRFGAVVSTSSTGSGSNTTYTSVYSFYLKSIIDPYGQTTNVAVLSDGSVTVTEPAGRWIRISYKLINSTAQGALNDKVVDRITASDGRSVQYNYTAYVTANSTRYTTLSSVVYFGDANYTATYVYKVDNIDPNGRPLMASCVDPMFDGPMWKIAYDFAPSSSALVSGQLLKEKHPNGTAVSTLTITSTSDPNKRKEIRGDNPTGTGNPSRTFSYNTYRLKNVTDFKGVSEITQYDNNFYLQAVVDRRGNQTDYNSNALTGNVVLVTEPVSDDVSPAGSISRTAYKYSNANAADANNRDANNPYYLASIEDGDGHAGQTFYRDTSKQVTSIVYGGSQVGVSFFTYATETFSYNSLGQLLTHGNKRGYTESYEYDPANPSRVAVYRDAEHPASGGSFGGKPSAWYHYDSLGRVDYITEGRGTSAGDAQYTTYFGHNARGQLTRLTHPDGTYIQYSYNTNGTLAWTADERHPNAGSDSNQRTSYTYDDYKRVRTVTTPLRAPGDATGRMTTYFYDDSANCVNSGSCGESYSLTAATPTRIISAGGKVTKTVRDENLRASSVTVLGDTNVSDAKVSYAYDPNGNVLTIKDPNGQANGAVTVYHYDKQNRVSSMDDAISIDRNSDGHTMSYTYDSGGRKIKEVRADNEKKQYAYDAKGLCFWIWGYGTQRDLQASLGGAGCSPGNCDVKDPIYYEADVNLNVTKITVGDAGNSFYTYTYDGLDRKKGAKYPPDYTSSEGRTESYTYDVANHLWTYTNPAGQVKTLTYDNRGRLTNTSWNINGPNVAIGYDATRPTSITSVENGVTTTIGFGYDEANNRIYEDQAINGQTRRVQTDPDADGSRINLVVKSGTNFSIANFASYFEYTSRNELRRIKDSGNNPFFTYSYDASGNVIQRYGERLHDAANFQYDALNRPKQCSLTGKDGAVLSTLHYDYRPIGNLHDVWRDEEGGKGEYFEYDKNNQLTLALYSASNVTTPSPTNPAKQVSYIVTDKNRKGMTVIDNVAGTTTTTTLTTNGLNQHQTIATTTGGSPGPTLQFQYDENFNRIYNPSNSLGYQFNAENRLMSVSGGHAQFIYDGIGRCVKRVVEGTTTFLTYDQWSPVAEWDGNWNLVATNVFGIGDDEILYRTAGSTSTTYKSDPMGNVKFLLGAAGLVAEKYTYDAFGQPKIMDQDGNSRSDSAPTLKNRFMFSGREFFPTLGIYDLRNRAYDPAMGSFLQTDPIGFAGDPTNIYRFCGNNPLQGGDPTGLMDGFTFTASLSDFSIGGTGTSYGWSDSSGPDFFNDPIDYSTIAWSTYSETLSFGQSQAVGGSALRTAGRMTGTFAQTLVSPVRNVLRVIFARNLDEFIEAQDGFWSTMTPLPIPAAGEDPGQYADNVARSFKGPEGVARAAAIGTLMFVGPKALGGPKQVPLAPELVAKDLPTLRISAAKYPDLAENVLQAQRAGHPDILTHGGAAQANRAAALQDVPSVAGLTRDEYPFASSMEGGAGSWVGHIPASQNSAGGGLLGSVVRRYSITPGDRYRVIVVSSTQ